MFGCSNDSGILHLAYECPEFTNQKRKPLAIDTKAYCSHLKKTCCFTFQINRNFYKGEASLFLSSWNERARGLWRIGLKQTTKCYIVRQGLLPEDLSVVHP